MRCDQLLLQLRDEELLLQADADADGEHAETKGENINILLRVKGVVAMKEAVWRMRATIAIAGRLLCIIFLKRG